MKIVYIITRADAVGGASIHVRDMARAMRERGHETTVLVGGLGPVTQQLEAAGVPFESLRWLRRQVNPLRDSLAVLELVRVLRRLQPDLVSTHTAKAGSVGRAAARWLGMPVIYTPHGWPAGERMGRKARAVFALVERVMARWCDAIICVCDYERRLALDKRIAEAEKLFVVRNGVRDVSADLHCNPEQTPVRICSVGRFDDPKDHRTLLEALATLRALNWSLDLVGDGPRQQEMQSLARTLGLGERVQFHGYLADPSGLLAQAQVFALSSRSEAFPRSILEAMRAGLPVVATDVGGVGEAVTPEVTGLLAPAGDAPALAPALRRLVESAPLRRSMGDAARAAYERSFRFEIMADLTWMVYATVQSRTARLRPPA
ncbi:MAG TPA: glycosyltransferase family 4 protein [Paludibaculum sp.]|jgi:glycosyltransferase involved in cell wall biosynthesis